MCAAKMTSRERVRCAFEHQEPDRLPRDLGGLNTATLHIDAHARLKHHLGLAGGESAVAGLTAQSAVVDPRILDRFGIDFLPLATKPPAGWKLQISTDEQGYRKYTDEWGIVRACPPGGFYYDIVTHPLAAATLGDLERFPWPDPADPGRFSGLADKAKDLYAGTDKCLVLSTGTSIFAQIGMLLGWEEFYRSLKGNQPLIRAMVARLVDFHERLILAALDQAGESIQVVTFNDDLTHQHGLFARKQIFQDIFLPGYRRLIQTIKGKGNFKISFHICGSSYLMFEELISLGVDAVNPVQVSADGMGDTAALKQNFGSRLLFWGGGCDTQHVLPQGPTEAVRREVRRRVADLAPGGGFIFCAVHNIQRDVPPEHIVAMYDEAIKWGDYPIRLSELRSEG